MPCFIPMWSAAAANAEFSAVTLPPFPMPEGVADNGSSRLSLAGVQSFRKSSPLCCQSCGRFGALPLPCRNSALQGLTTLPCRSFNHLGSRASVLPKLRPLRGAAASCAQVPFIAKVAVVMPGSVATEAAAFQRLNSVATEVAARRVACCRVCTDCGGLPAIVRLERGISRQAALQLSFHQLRGECHEDLSPA